jgi:2-oxoglutarate ferredoxin oxidoreductase subunit beta
VNNQIYAMTGGQTAPTTPDTATTSSSPYTTFEPHWNLPHLVDAAGAVFVARWTTYHVKQLEKSMTELLLKKGFGFVEVISPCPTLYQRRNGMGEGLDAMKYYKQVSKVKNGAPTWELQFAKEGEIIVGKFVDRERPEYLDTLRDRMRSKLGARYVETAACSGCGGSCDAAPAEGGASACQ